MTNKNIFTRLLLFSFMILFFSACEFLMGECDPTTTQDTVSEECVDSSSIKGILIYFPDPEDMGINRGVFYGSPTVISLQNEGISVSRWCPCGVLSIDANTQLDLLELKEKATNRLSQNGENGYVTLNYKLDEIEDDDVLDLDVVEIPLSTNFNSIVGLIDGPINPPNDRVKDNLYTNPNEIEGNNQDDDGNGYVDDIHGRSFIDNSDRITVNNGKSAHGTQTWGVIDLATEQNDEFHTSFAPLVVNDLHSLSCAILYAAMMDFDVVNASVGFSVDAQNIEENDNLEAYFAPLLERLKAKDILLVASAGNCGIDTDHDRIHYPSGLTNMQDSPVISVAATDEKNTTLATFSNFGIESTDVAAPGENVETYDSDPNKLRIVSGTSFSAPLVTAQVIKIKVANPNLSYLEIKECLIRLSKSNSNLPKVKGGILSDEVNCPE